MNCSRNQLDNSLTYIVHHIQLKVTVRGAWSAADRIHSCGSAIKDDSARKDRSSSTVVCMHEHVPEFRHNQRRRGICMSLFVSARKWVLIEPRVTSKSVLCTGQRWSLDITRRLYWLTRVMTS